MLELAKRNAYLYFIYILFSIHGGYPEQLAKSKIGNSNY